MLQSKPNSPAQSEKNLRKTGLEEIAETSEQALGTTEEPESMLCAEPSK